MRADPKKTRREPVTKIRARPPPQRVSQHNPDRADRHLRRFSWQTQEDAQ